MQSISMRKMIPWFFGLVLAALMVTSHSTAQTKPGAPLFNDLGDHRHPISTKSPQAQQYFNQGLILAYGLTEHQNLAEGKRFSPLLVLTLARFGRWDEVLNEPLPPTDQTFAKAMFHYARGMSYGAKLDFAAAQTELSALEAIAGDPRTKPLDQPQLPGAKLIVLGKHILAGELAGRRSQNTEMNQYFATAFSSMTRCLIWSHHTGIIR